MKYFRGKELKFTPGMEWILVCILLAGGIFIRSFHFGAVPVDAVCFHGVFWSLFLLLRYCKLYCSAVPACYGSIFIDKEKGEMAGGFAMCDNLFCGCASGISDHAD